jgi:Flp pilus assembly pilin Flp
MKSIRNQIFGLAGTLAGDRRGQDLIEYALLAASIAVAVGATFPQTIGPSVCAIFSKVISCFGASHNVGS